VRPWNLIRTARGMRPIDCDSPGDWTTRFAPADLERTCECFRLMRPLDLDWRDRRAG
jgi:hypothetical protein